MCNDSNRFSFGCNSHWPSITWQLAHFRNTLLGPSKQLNFFIDYGGHEGIGDGFYAVLIC